MNKGITFILFLLSPILSLPIILKSIYNKKYSGYVFIALFFSVLSYLYIPHWSNDKMTYFALQQSFVNYSLNDFILYILAERSDFIFYLLIFIFSKLGVSFSLTGALITGFTVYMFMWIFRQTLDNYYLSKNKAFSYFLIFLFSFSLPMLLSGMRFYLGASFALVGLYFIFIDGKYLKGFIFLFLAIFTHFSLVVYIPISILFIILKNKPNILRIAFLISFAFLLLSKEDLYSVISNYSFNDALTYKMNSYLLENDLIESTLEGGSANAKLIIFLKKFWYYLAGIYFLLHIKKKNKYIYLAMIVYTVNNIVYASPTMFDRYSLISIAVFILLLISSSLEYKSLYNKIFINCFALLVLMNFIINVVVMRDNFNDSYLRYEVLTLPSIIIYDPMESFGHIEGKRY